MDNVLEILHHSLHHSIIDTLKMLPFLYAAFLLMEFIEHHAGEKLASALEKAGKSNIGGSAAGVVLGCIPQCGFSVAASNLYSSRIIRAGTLMAVFISTSDEALPILLAHPDMLDSVWKLILAKIIIGIIAGVLFNFIIKENENAHFDDICSNCGCEKHSIWLSALRHTVEIFVFIFLVNFIMTIIIEAAGEDNVAVLLDGMGIFQPFAAALVGLIPNCASSVIITELFADGAIPFGTAVGGLCTGAGVGLITLFRTNKNMKENFIFLIYLYIVGVVSGILLNFIF